MVVLAKYKDDKRDILYEEGGKVPFWSYYTQAYEYARQNKLKNVVAIEFYSLNDAIVLHGDIFIDAQGGARHVGTHSQAWAENSGRREDTHHCCLV